MRRIFVFAITVSLLFSLSCENGEDPEPNRSIASNQVYAIYIDANGMKWFGTDKGLSAFDGESWTTYTADDHLISNLIRDITFQDSYYGPEIWLATEGGASVLSIELDAVSAATTYSTSNSGLIGNDVFSVGLDANDNRWFGTINGVSVFAGQTWVSTDNSGLLTDNPVIDIGADQDGYTFLATNGAGIAVMQYETDAISTVTYYEFPWSPVPESNIITSVFVDPDGNQWYGSHNGILEHDGDEAKTGWSMYTKDDDGLPSDSITCITGDSEGIIWAGTKDAGTASFDGSVWTKYTVDDGLISNKVHCIAIDNDGSVWFGTNNGVSHLQGGTWTTYQAE